MKNLPHKYENLNLILRTQVKKKTAMVTVIVIPAMITITVIPAMVTAICDPSLGEVERARAQGSLTIQPSLLVELQATKRDLVSKIKDDI